MRNHIGSLRWALLCSGLFALAQSASTLVVRSFERVQLLEEKGETSAGVSVGDLNGDGLLDIVLGKGRHWPNTVQLRQFAMRIRMEIAPAIL